MVNRRRQPLSKKDLQASMAREAAVIIRRARDLGLDRRGKTGRLLRWLQQNPTQPLLRTELLRRIAAEEQVQLIAPDPFRASSLWAPDALAGSYSVGVVPQTGFPYGLTDRMLLEHILIFGRSGGGKTTTVKTGMLEMKRISPDIVLIIIERKREYTDLAKELGMHIITTETLRINTLRPPSRVPDRVWPSVFAQSFMEDQEILVPTGNLIMDATRELLESRHVADSYPTLPDLYRHIEGKRYPTGSRLIQYQSAALNRIGGLLNALPDTFNNDVGYDVSQMIHTDHLILLHDIPHLVHQNYLIKLLLDQIFVYRMVVEGLQGRVTVVILLDEGASLFRRTDEVQRIPSYLSYIITQARAYGIAIIVTSQYAGDLSYALIANTATKILVGGMEKTDDRRAFLDLRPHSPEQADVVKSFRDPGHAFISDPRHTHFIECMIHQPGLPQPMEPAEVAARARETARTLGWIRDEPEQTVQGADTGEDMSSVPPRSIIPDAPPPAPRPPEPDRDMVVLTDIEQTPFQTFEKRIERLKTTKAQLKETVDRLEAKNLIIVHKFHFRGGTPRDLYEVTEKGCQAVGKEKPAGRGHGSYLHQTYQRFVAKFWKAKGYEVHIEGRADEKAVDIIAVQRPEGETVAIEIELHAEQKEHMIHNLSVDLAAPRVTRVVCLVPTKKEAKIVEKTIKATPELLAVRDRIAVDCVWNHMEIKE